MDKNEYPILANICRCFEIFSDRFTEHNENYKESYIFENRKITRTLESKDYINRNMVGLDFFLTNSKKFYELKYSNFYTLTDRMIPADEVIATTGIEFPPLLLQTIRAICLSNRIRFRKTCTSKQSSTTIDTFVNRNKKGSKHFRRILTVDQTDNIPHNINKFADNMDIIIDEKQSKLLNTLWMCNFFDNAEKTFFFKFVNNTLGYNNRVAHFVENHSPNCTFCDITQNPTEYSETPLHLFFDCPSVVNVIEESVKLITGDRTIEFSKREFFVDYDRRDFSFAKNRVLTIISKLTIKYIWDCRSRKTVPTTANCTTQVRDRLRKMSFASGTFKNFWLLSNFENLDNDQNL